MTTQATVLFHIMGIIWIVFQVAGPLFSLGIGLSSMRRKRLTSYAVATGILVNLPGCLGDGGPDLFAGLILFPVICILAAHLGRGIRWLLIRMGILGKTSRIGNHPVE